MQLCTISKRKRALQALCRNDSAPENDELLWMLVKSQGNYLFSGIIKSNKQFLISILNKFRNAYQFSPNTYAICIPLDNIKFKAEIACTVTEDQILQPSKTPYWCKHFTPLPFVSQIKAKGDNHLDDGMLPPSENKHEDLSGAAFNESQYGGLTKCI